jgi:hypothetical protein
MRNGFVAGKLDAAVDGFGRLDGLFFHAQILPCRFIAHGAPREESPERTARRESDVGRNLSWRTVFAAAIWRASEIFSSLRAYHG